MGAGSENVANYVIRQSIMAYTREKLIDHNLWEKFVAELRKAREEDVLSEQDIALILASHNTGRLLAEKQYPAIKEIASQKNVNRLKREIQDAKTLKIAEGKRRKIAQRISKTFILFCMPSLGIILFLLLRRVDLHPLITWGIPLIPILPWLCVIIFGKHWDAQSIITKRKRIESWLARKIEGWIAKLAGLK